MSNWNQANPRYRRTRANGRPLGQGFLTNLRARLASGGRGDRQIKGALFLIVVLVLVAAIWRLWPHFGAFVSSPEPTPPSPAPTAEPAATISGPQLPPWPELPMGSWSLWADRLNREIVTEVVTPVGGTISQSLEALGLTRKTSQLLIDFLAESQYGLTLRPGAVFKAYWRDPQKEDRDLSRLEFVAAPGRRPLIFRPGGEKGFFLYDLAAKPLIIRQASQGVVEDTFYGAGEKAGLEPRVIMGLTDLLASQIDFVSDIKAGDTFQILFRGRYQEGQLIAPPEIEMIRMTNGEEKFEFYRHDKNQALAGFYDSSLRSIKKDFFKSPLQFTRISSSFTNKRYHPILKIVRPHLGVDYAAPAGTPVATVADGEVDFAGRRGGYGLLVVIKHARNYQTMYGHLSRIAKGVKAGTKIKQGDLIGYVGSTGLATGPHLDFRLKRQNEFVNPLPELAKIEGAPLPPDERDAFTSEVTQAQTHLKELLSWDSPR